MKRVIYITVFLFCMLFLLNVSASAPTVSGNDFTDEQKAEQRQQGLDIWKQTYNAVQRGDKYIKIPAGDYRVNGGTGYLGAFTINGAKDLYIDAEGVTFWSETNETVLKITNSSGCTIKGLTIDYDPIGAVQGTIISVDESDKSFDILLDDGCPIPDGKWSDAAADGKMKAIFFDESGSKMVEGVMDYTNSIISKGNGIYTVKLKWNTRFEKGIPSNQKIKEGMRFVSPWRRSSAVDMNYCSDMLFEDITVYAASGFAIGEHYGEGGNTYRRVNLVRRPNTSRLLAANADGIHSGGAAKGPLIENCELSYAGDDLLNIRGFYDIVLKKVSGNTLVIGIPESEVNFKVGSALNFYDIKNFSYKKSAEVVSFEEYSDGETEQTAANIVNILGGMGISVNPNLGTNVVPIKCYKVTFSENVEDIEQYAVADCRDYCGSGAVIRNNRLHNTITAGIRVRSSNTVIADNIFERCGESAVVLRGERYWLEGGFSENVVIKNNVITEAACLNPTKNSMYSAAVSISGNVDYNNSPDAPNIKNITVSGNRIYKSCAQAILAWNVDGLTLDKNIIDYPFYSESNKSKFDPYAVWINGCTDVYKYGNSTVNVPSDVIGEQSDGSSFADYAAPMIWRADVSGKNAQIDGVFDILTGSNSKNCRITAVLKDENGNIANSFSVKGGAGDFDFYRHMLSVDNVGGGKYTLSLAAESDGKLLRTYDFNVTLTADGLN